MPNPGYVKGANLERRIVNEARANGMIAFRSAGSHSPIDVITISAKGNSICFFQCKASQKRPSEEFKNLKIPSTLTARKIWVSKAKERGKLNVEVIPNE